jgi:hypothetical protein
MVDFLSNATKSREIGPARSRSQVSSASRDGGSGLGITARRQVEAAGEPSKSRHYLTQTEGLVVDTEA